MEKLASEYRGPHRVILNRNPTNLGIVGHVNRIMELASGQLVLGMAGDDICYSERAATTYAIWEACGRPHYLFFSLEPFSDEPIGGEGYQFREASMRAGGMIDLPGATVLAPTAAWRRDVFDLFGPLPASARSEEKSIAFRAALLGEIIFVSKPLVRYRIHEGNISVIKASQRTRQNTLQARRRVLEWHLGRIEGFRQDLRVALEIGRISAQECDELLDSIRRNERLLTEQLELYDGNGYRRVRAAVRLARRASAAKSGLLRKAKAFSEQLLIRLFC